MFRTLILGALALLMFPSQAATKAPKDFALRMEFGCAGRDVVDTRAGTYVRHMSLRRPQVADVFVSSKLKDQLFNLVSEARFFELESPVTGLGICEPTTRYQLQVTSDGRTHVVGWGECHLPETSDEGRRVRTLAEEILKPFQKMGAVKQLRKQDMLCL